LQKDPFQQLDTEGVGELIKMTVDRARAVNPDVTFGVSTSRNTYAESLTIRVRSKKIDYTVECGCRIWSKCIPLSDPSAKSRQTYVSFMLYMQGQFCTNDVYVIYVCINNTCMHIFTCTCTDLYIRVQVWYALCCDGVLFPIVGRAFVWSEKKSQTGLE